MMGDFNVEPNGDKNGPKRVAFETNNYSPLNASIDNLIKRHQDSTYLKFLLRFWHYGRAFSLFFIGLAVGILILAIAYYVYSRSFNSSGGVFSSSISTVQEKIIVRIPDENKSRVIERPVIIEKPIYTPIRIPVKTGVVSNFTIFQRAEIALNMGNFIVVTGAQFPTSEKKYPTYQYCYLEESDGDNDPRNANILYLANKDENYPPLFHNFYDINNIKLPISAKEFGLAQKKCQFMEGGGISADNSIEEPSEEPPEGNSTGSGFAVNALGYFVTNEHVVSDCKFIKLRENERFYTGKIISKDKELDLAIVKISASNGTQYVHFATNIRTGDDVVALGFPLGDALGNEIKVTTGNISAMVGLQGDKKTLQFTAPIQPGSSGGPLLNRKGALVGVNSSGLRGADFENINFAVKSIELQKYLSNNKVEFSVSSQSDEISTADIVERGNKYTKQFFCINS
jgi:S1-C subfamily serine protease